MALINQNVSNVETTSFDLLPEGWYDGQITSSEMKTTKAGNGEFLELEITLIGTMAGRKVWDRLNLVNPNADAVKISQETLKSICDSVGHPGNVQDSQELHMKPLQFRVKHDGSYVNVCGYRKIEGAPAVAGQTIPSTNTPSAPPVGGQFKPPGL